MSILCYSSVFCCFLNRLAESAKQRNGEAEEEESTSGKQHEWGEAARRADEDRKHRSPR